METNFNYSSWLNPYGKVSIQDLYLVFKEVNYTLKFLKSCRKNNKTLQRLMTLIIVKTKARTRFYEH